MKRLTTLCRLPIVRAGWEWSRIIAGGVRRLLHDKGAALALVCAMGVALVTVTNARTEGAAPAGPPSATLTVTKIEDTDDGVCDADCSLREAIAAASDGDTIDFSAGLSGTITLGSRLKIDKSLVIAGPGASQLTVSGNNAGRVFLIAPGNYDVTISGLTISNGYCEPLCGDVPTGSGGGIFSQSSGKLSILRSIVTRNTAGWDGGGGIYNSGTLNVTDSIISSNRARFSFGGGIYNSGTLNVTDSIISGNTALYSGGGIYNSGMLTVINSTISSNYADVDGGGIYNSVPLATAYIVKTAIVGNFSVDGIGGGGIMNRGRLTVNDSTFARNYAHFGGGSGAGIFNALTAYITNSTFYNNSAGGAGVGIYNRAGGMLTLTNSTISGSWAGYPGILVRPVVSPLGAGITNRGTGAAFNVLNCIVAKNSPVCPYAGGCPPANVRYHDVQGDFTSLGHNLIGDGTGSTGFTHGVNGDLVGSQSAPIDPLLGPLQDNGGMTQTMALLTGSPAIDAGAAATDPATGLPLNTDQRGLPRPRDLPEVPNAQGGDGSDIGAFEVQPVAASGCGPGFWKNHPAFWNATGYRTDQEVGEVFGGAGSFPSLASLTLRQALDGGGGPGPAGGARILLRAAVAALLNSAHPGVTYPRHGAIVIAEVNAALLSQNRARMLGLASALDEDNNLVCPLE